MKLRVDAPDFGEVASFAQQLVHRNVETMTILAGNAAHAFEDRQWSESFARLHISMVNRHEKVRVAIDLGADSLRGIDLTPLNRVATALGRIAPAEPQVTSISLMPQVAATLWPAILFSGASWPIEQSTHPSFPFDGDGKVIEPKPVGTSWPNRYRPSYRTRPVPMPYHLSAAGFGESSRTEWRAIGVVEPFQITHGTISARLLFESDHRVFAARLTLPLPELLEKIRFVGSPGVWFPYAAGSYGSDVEISPVQLTA